MSLMYLANCPLSFPADILHCTRAHNNFGVKVSYDMKVFLYSFFFLILFCETVHVHTDYLIGYEVTYR